MIRRLLALALVLAAAACHEAPRPVRSADNDNPAVYVDVVTRVEGCTIYRVAGDAERTYRFVKCEAPAVVTTVQGHTECTPCGKGCTRCVEIDDTVITATPAR